MKLHLRTPIPIVMALLLGAALGAAAAHRPPPVTGMYSSMRVTPSGDVGGWEFFVLRGHHGDYVLLQLGEGQIGDPVLVPATLTPTTLTLELSGTAFEAMKWFRGRFEAGRLRGEFGTEHTVDLPRGQSYWQRP